jgi:hypothetical protein
MDALPMPLAGGGELDLLDQNAWRQMNPALHLCDAQFFGSLGTLTCNAETGLAIQALVKREGYFQAPPQDWRLPLELMAQTVSRFKQMGLSPVFAFVYDEYWASFAKLAPIAQYLLGEDYWMLPDFWVWHVDPKSEDSGWRPHRDKGHAALFPDGRPKSVTMWLPLSDADTLNGCMYIVPAHRDPTYGTPADKTWKFEYSDIRAIPAKAGSVLAWNQAVLHWGSRSSERAEAPRVSMALEFQRGDVPAFNKPLIRPGFSVPFRARLQLICKQILQYQHMYPLAAPVARVAEKGCNLEGWPEVLRPAA